MSLLGHRSKKTIVATTEATNSKCSIAERNQQALHALQARMVDIESSIKSIEVKLDNLISNSRATEYVLVTNDSEDD